MKREVAAALEFEVTEPTRIEMKIAVANPDDAEVRESMRVVHNDDEITAREVVVEHGTRIHMLDCAPGKVTVDYSATVNGSFPSTPVTEADLSMYLRPSRYAEADKFFGFAASRFGSPEPDAETLARIVEFVEQHLIYTPGASRGTDSAADTLLSGAGVCRDYAHLTIALLRAVNIPARLVSVFAPGCSPMDFHAVTEAYVDGAWCVVDPTRLAPRSSLVRIATGRDAADTAFLDNHGGSLTLKSSKVTAVVVGSLPVDEYASPVSLG